MKSREFKLVFNAIQDRRSLYLGAAADLISAGIAAVIPYIYGRLVDIAIAPHSEMNVIMTFILVWLFLSLARNYLDLYSSRAAYYLSIDARNILVIDLFQHILDLPMQFHKEKRIGKVLDRIERGVQDVLRLIEETLFGFLPSIVSLVIALVILLFVEWQLSLILIAASICFVIVTFSHTKEIVKKQKPMNRAWEKAYGDLWDSVLNVDAVKAATNEKFEKQRNIKNFGVASTRYKSWRLIWQQMSGWQTVIFSLSFVAVFSAGILMLRAGTLTPGKLIMFVGYTSLLNAPLSQLAQQYRTFKSAIFNFGHAAKYFDIVPERDAPNAIALKDLRGEVLFKNASFGYKKESAVLRDISFEARQGESIALVGESGVGKSTLVSLISRYNLPQKGEVLIDGIDIRKIKLKSLRDQIAIVPQEVLLFNDTIKNNIKYGRISATDKEIIAAAQAANTHEFIEKFPKKYNQLVGERGIKLSTGQKQRVAIARAILRNPKILILDEATSALDSASEKLVQEALKKLIAGRTTFIIAHRLSTIQHADKIIVLENGTIAEIGNHAELMKNSKGIYRNFWEMQTAISKVG